jgi:hypothetical protein
MTFKVASDRPKVGRSFPAEVENSSCSFTVKLGVVNAMLPFWWYIDAAGDGIADVNRKSGFGQD